MAYKVIDIEMGPFMWDDKHHLTLEEHILHFVNNHVLYEIKNKSDDVLILTTWCEEYNAEQLETIEKSIDIIKNNFSFRIALILGMQYKRERRLRPNPIDNKFNNVDHYYVHGFPFRFYTKIFDHKICEPCDVYLKKSENKFLLLIGKPHKDHRIRLLYKLYKKDLLKHCLWRFRIHNEGVRKTCRKLMNDVSDQEYELFLKTCERDLDNVQMDYQEYSSHYSGIPFERWIWDSCMFQVIPEVDFYDNFPSEKTWLAIINKMPFISVAQMNHNKGLRDLGFITFEKYLLHKNYNEDDRFTNESHCDAKLDIIIENIKYWIENVDKYYEEIKLDVERNFNTFVGLVKSDEAILNSIIEKYNLNCKPEDLIVGYYK